MRAWPVEHIRTETDRGALPLSKKECWDRVHRSCGMLYQRKGSKRGPRPEELLFLRSLASGPRVVVNGPVGRCVKQGWCTLVVAGETSSAFMVALTPTGAVIVEETHSANGGSRGPAAGLLDGRLS